MWNVANHRLARDVLAGLTEHYGALACFAEPARLVVASLNDLGSDSTYKMSGEEYQGFNFYALFRKHSLHEVPRSYQAAAVAAVLLNPRPDALNFTISPTPELQSLYTGESPYSPAIGSAWLREYSTTPATMLARERLAYDELNIPHLGLYALFHNYGLSATASCATRVLQLLGHNGILTDSNHLVLSSEPLKLRDPNKLGMHSPALINYLISRWHPLHYAFDDTNSPEGPDASTYADLARAFPMAKILVCVHDGHVSYAIRKEFMLREVALYRAAYANQTPQLSWNDKQQLIAAFPANVGRAGARVHLTLPDLLSHTLTSAQRAILKTALLYKRSARVSDLESTFLTCLSLTCFLEGAAGVDLVMFILRNAKYLFTRTTKEVTKFLKSAHAHVRIYQALPGQGLPYTTTSQLREYGDLLYGLDSLMGRSDKLTLDFSAELLMRTADPIRRAVPTLSSEGKSLEFSEELFELFEDRATTQTFMELLPAKINLEPFEHWYSRRMFWGASGGAPGAKITWSESNGGEALRLNKRGALLAIPASHFRLILEKALDPVLWSVKALKYEPGKLRSILNTSMEHYVFQAYLLDHFDANVQSGNWYAIANSGSARLRAHVSRLADLTQEAGFMWDFADFNINHTFRGMVKLFHKLEQFLLSRANYANDPNNTKRAAEDIKALTRWVNMARQNTYLSDNDTKETMQIRRSLQSGERATMWVNTLRNNIDHRIVSQVSQMLFGYDLAPKPGHKTGDDVFLTVRDISDAILMCSLYNLTGAAGQIHKIMLSYNAFGGARGEFVRYAYDASSGRVAGYPLRSLVGVVHGEFFSEPLTNPAERAATIIEQVAKVRRRGVQLPEHFLNALVSKASRLVYTKNKTTHTVSIPQALVHLPAAEGGVGVSADANGNVIATENNLNGIKLTTPNPLAICIPSGEGKSTLARRYPSLFVDHDDLRRAETDHLVAQARVTGNWEAVNAEWRSVVGGEQRVLLTWHPQTIPSTHTLVAVAYLARGNGLRANRANRRALERARQARMFSEKIVIRATTLNELHGAVVKRLVSLINVRASKRLAMVHNETNQIGQMPTLLLDLPGASGVLKAAKTSIIDYDSLQRYGVENGRASVDTSVLKSALTAAYPARSISEALASLAQRLHKYLKTHTIRALPMGYTLPFDQGYWFNRTAAALKEYLPLVAETAYVPTPRHSYNSIVSLMRPAGFSNGAALALAVAAPAPTHAYGRLGSLCAFLDIAGHKSQAADASSNLALAEYRAKLLSLIALSPKTAAAHDRLYQYLSGDCNFYPPVGTNLPTEMVALARDIALVQLEAAKPDYIITEPHRLRVFMAQLDTIAQLALVSHLQDLRPNFHIRD